MKRYTEYKGPELAQMEDVQIDTLIELEIAHAGILPIMCPEPPSIEHAGITRSEIVFEVAGVLCKNEGDAQTIAGMELLKSAYEYNIGYDYKWLNPETKVTVTKTLFYKQEDVVRVRALLTDNERKLEEYKEKKQSYDDFLSKTGKIRNKVWGAVNEAKDFADKVNYAKTIWVKHLDLAEDNRTIARSFFVNVYEDDEEIRDAVIVMIDKEEI